MLMDMLLSDACSGLNDLSLHSHLSQLENGYSSEQEMTRIMLQSQADYANSMAQSRANEARFNAAMLMLTGGI